MAARVPGPQAPAPVQRLRLRYAKRGRMRFSSTRDFQRALERALRRAGVPMAFSSGFHPHPRISYTNAAPTGTASEAEYAELALVERLDPEAVRVALDAALPAGLDVVEVVESRGGSLADRLEASSWEVVFPGLPTETLHQACAQFLAAERVEVSRVLKNGPRIIDARGPVLALAVTGDVGQAGCAILHMVVRHTTPTVRPDDVLTAIRTTTLLREPNPPIARRLAQGPLTTDPVGVSDPLATDREVTGT